MGQGTVEKNGKYLYTIALLIMLFRQKGIIMQKHTLLIISLHLCCTSWGMNWMNEREIKKEQERERAILRERYNYIARYCREDNFKYVKEYLASDIDKSYPANFCFIDDVKTVRMAVLLERRGIALDDKRNEFDESILHRACHADCTPMLLQYSVRNYCNKKKTLKIDELAVEDQTPLHVWAECALYDGVPRAKYLLDALQKMDILFEAGADSETIYTPSRTPRKVLEEQLEKYKGNGWEDVEKAYDILIYCYRTAESIRNYKKILKLTRDVHTIEATQRAINVYQDSLKPWHEKAREVVEAAYKREVSIAASVAQKAKEFTKL